MSTAEIARVFALAPQYGFARHAIAEAMGISLIRCNNIIDKKASVEWRERKRVWDAAQGPSSKPSRQFADLLRVTPPQYADPLRYGKPKNTKWKYAVVYGDSHEPFADLEAMAVVRGVIGDVRPHLVVHVGDLGDCYTISRFSTDPSRQQSLQGDIDMMGAHLHQTAQCAPNAERILLEGNHENRLQKLIWNLQGAARELPRLRIFQKVMTWPSLLGLDQLGWDFVPYQKQPILGRLSKLALKHGNVVRKWSGWSAKGEWEKHAKGGLSGHTHRLGAFYHRDLSGSHVWWECGCTCGLEPEYVQQPDWQSACVVVTYNDDRFQVEPVYIQGGKAIWRGSEYSA